VDHFRLGHHRNDEDISAPIETNSKRVLKRLVQVSRRDRKHSRRTYLSDAGRPADLQKHGSKDANVLVLGR
jgi:hypothetical protein